MHREPQEPELPAPVPEKRDAVTPDLPPAGPTAPDVPTGRPGPDEGPDPEGGGEAPPAGPGNAPPQEPSD